MFYHVPLWTSRIWFIWICRRTQGMHSPWKTKGYRTCITDTVASWLLEDKNVLFQPPPPIFPNLDVVLCTIQELDCISADSSSGGAFGKITTVPETVSTPDASDMTKANGNQFNQWWCVLDVMRSDDKFLIVNWCSVPFLMYYVLALLLTQRTNQFAMVVLLHLV